MAEDLVSLAIIACIAVLCPLITHSIPRKPIPETVFLILAGALLGPSMAGVISLSDSVEFLSDLGLSFLFLLAGYEINPSSIGGRQGRRGLLTWGISFALAFTAVRLSPDFSISHIDGLAVAIALTTTALGTLMPILKERAIIDTPVGQSVLAYGTWGELAPVLAMALLLSSRSEIVTLLVLGAFAALAIVMAVIPSRSKKAGHRFYVFIAEHANTTSQTMVRFVVLILITLIAVSAVFDLDIVLGAFAAGFVLRYIIPEGNHTLETKLDGIAYGLLIPIFFVVSGAKIDLGSVASKPALLIGFILMLLLIRALPIFISLSTDKTQKDMSPHNRITVSLYCTTALPIIVAVTSLATKSGAMPQETAGVLVAAGAITVLLMPLLASFTYRVADVQPIEAVREITRNPHEASAIIHEHLEAERTHPNWTGRPSDDNRE